MQKYLLPLLFTPLAFADPAVKHVQVNIHNESPHVIKFLQFEASRIYQNVELSAPEVDRGMSAYNAVQFSAFDLDPMSVKIPVVIDGEVMQFMWQTNMGFGGPDGDKFHICGVIKDNGEVSKRQYCEMPYVIADTFYIDFIIQ